MINFEDFSEAVLQEVCKKAGGEFKAEIKTVTKNNNIRLTGLAAMAEGKNSGPCVYLNSLYEGYKDREITLKEIADKVYGLLRDSLDDMPEFDIAGFKDWERARYNVRAKLVNAAQNKELLVSVPHRLFLDLAVVYYAIVNGPEEQGIGMILINNQHMKMWGLEEENLYQTAMSNMHADGEPYFESFEDIVTRMASLEENLKRQPKVDMYILSNCYKHYGASEILNQSVMRSIADRIGDKFIVLPSSQHEVIILKADKKTDYKKFADMVKEVNDTQLSEEERLSDHVYVYSRNEETLKVAA